MTKIPIPPESFQIAFFLLSFPWSSAFNRCKEEFAVDRCSLSALHSTRLEQTKMQSVKSSPFSGRAQQPQDLDLHEHLSVESTACRQMSMVSMLPKGKSWSGRWFAVNSLDVLGAAPFLQAFVWSYLEFLERACLSCMRADCHRHDTRAAQKKRKEAWFGNQRCDYSTSSNALHRIRQGQWSHMDTYGHSVFWQKMLSISSQGDNCFDELLSSKPSTVSFSVTPANAWKINQAT